MFWLRMPVPGPPNLFLFWGGKSMVGADFRDGDEDSNFSLFRVRRFTESPGPLHWIAFPVEILTKPLIHWIASPLFTENPFFSLKSASSHPLPKNRLRNGTNDFAGSFPGRSYGPGEPKKELKKMPSSRYRYEDIISQKSENFLVKKFSVVLAKRENGFTKTLFSLFFQGFLPMRWF